ncbi:MAG TPA: class I SAM-dependent methyltransferase [Beijerinckiaceae bacterium]|nr:class I SAM-dependent methyltransferase [Beijerinckiaceae bacterium]
MDVQKYWTERAATDSANATTNDVYLRVLERVVIQEHLRRLGCNETSRVLDAGCGDGETLFALDDSFGCRLVGRDYAASMIDLARTKQASRPNSRIDFAIGDVRRIAQDFGDEGFDFILTDRCLINLTGEAEQYDAIAGIAQTLRPGGHYLAIENFVDGNNKLNELRASFGLPPIEIRWHNKFFNEADFVSRVSPLFRAVEKFDFSSSYYLATRVIYSKFCAIEGNAPDYRHPIHELSASLPSAGDFSPIKLFVLSR